MLRLSWTQPEDLVPHALRAAELDGCDVEDLRDIWLKAGGSAVAAVSGSSPTPAPETLRKVARELFGSIDERLPSASIRETEPDGFEEILALSGPLPGWSSNTQIPRTEYNRVLGAWLGRAAGCLLGKPVEKVPREGIRAIAQSTGNWPINSYFTAAGLDPEVGRSYPWNRRSMPTSLLENINGMPEDDDLNFPLIALELLERTGGIFSTDDVALSWLSNLPGGRVFTAERLVYRNLLEGHEPDVAATIKNPFQDWIGAQIRADLYGWVRPGNVQEAARLAWTDARLSHRRNGLYGAMFAAAASSAALTADSIEQVIEAGLSVVPANSRYAQAVHRGIELGRSDLPSEEALDVLYSEYGALHWVHVLNNSALLAFALIRGNGDFEATITTAVTGGWDTDSVGATAGSLVGALTGADNLPDKWISPLKDTLATSVPGFDAISFSALAHRTLAVTKRSAS